MTESGIFLVGLLLLIRSWKLWYLIVHESIHFPDFFLFTFPAYKSIREIFFRVGVLGNLLVILSVIQYKSLQSVRNLFIVSLSVTDIIILIVSGTITPITAFNKVWIFGELLCYFVPLLQVSWIMHVHYFLMFISWNLIILSSY